MTELVLQERVGQIDILTLNRPEKLNALSYSMVDSLTRLLDEIESDDDVRAVILTGAGQRAFSAGADIDEFAGTIERDPAAAVREFCRRGQDMTARLENFPKPVITAVNGIAFGGGCEIVEASHLAISSNRALFAKPEIKLGILPTFGGTQRLPRIAGRKIALELLLSGEPISPSRAFELGLINEVVAHDELLAAAIDLAERITRHSPQTVSRIISSVNRGLNVTIEQGLSIERDQFALLAAAPDVRQRIGDWIARRSANRGNELSQ